MGKQDYDINEKIVNDFNKNYNLYRELDGIIYEKLTSIIKKKKFFIMEVSHRVKTVKSLKGKLKKKKGKYVDIHEITDLCAARVICYFAETVDEIALALREYFDVDEENSIDKRASLNATQFGYLSLHYIVSLKKDEGYAPELSDIKVEIQIRTVLQHAWAEIEHDLGYKSEFGVPRPIRREFSRIAGLLEIADNQFLELKNNVEQYKNDIKSQIASGQCLDLPLDEVTLNEFILHNQVFTEQVQQLADQLNVEYIPSPADKYLKKLDWLGIKTLGNLIDTLKLNQELTANFIKIVLKKYNLDILTTTMVIKNMGKAELIRGKYTYKQMCRYMQLNATEKRSKEVIDDLLERVKMINNL